MTKRQITEEIKKDNKCIKIFNLINQINVNMPFSFPPPPKIPS